MAGRAGVSGQSRDFHSGVSGQSRDFHSYYGLQGYSVTEMAGRWCVLGHSQDFHSNRDTLIQGWLDMSGEGEQLVTMV